MLYPAPHITEVKARAISRAVAYDVARRRHNERVLDVREALAVQHDALAHSAPSGNGAAADEKKGATVAPPRAYMPEDVSAVPLFALGEGRVSAILSRLSAIDAELSSL